MLIGLKLDRVNRPLCPYAQNAIAGIVLSFDAKKITKMQTSSRIFCVRLDQSLNTNGGRRIFYQIKAITLHSSHKTDKHDFILWTLFLGALSEQNFVQSS